MTPTRILLVQFADIGDLTLATPAIQALREQLPDAYLALLTSAHAAPIIPHGLVDGVLALDKAQFNGTKSFFMPRNLRRIFALGKFDTVIFFHHFTLTAGTLKFALIARAVGAKRRLGLQNGKGWFLTDSVPDEGFGGLHQADYWLKLVGLLGADSSPRPVVVATESSDLLPPALDGQKTVILHAGSGGYSLARRWDAASFAAVGDALSADGLRVVLVGGKDDDSAAVIAKMTASLIDLTGRTTLPQLAGILSGADLFIGADSGVMHLAAAAKAPVLALFGASNADAWRPYTPESAAFVLRSAVECSPCSYVGHEIGLREGCAARTCMRLITPEQVTRIARRMLSGEVIPAPILDYPPVKRAWTRTPILGLPVDGITYAQLLETLGAWIMAGDRCRHICTTNPEFTMIAQKDSLFANILRRADLCVPDGVGLLWAAKRRGVILPERVTGSDSLPIIAEEAAKRGWKLFFLGAAEGVAAQAAAILRTRYPGLAVVGVYSGSPAPEEEDALVAMINASHADILFVAYGAPKQDKWIARNLPRLQVGMAMGVGGAFDFIAGIVPRAPLWMRRVGIEWLYRLIRQPWRAKRMLRLPRFVLAVLRRKD